MSIWNRFIGLRNAEDSISNKKISVQYNALRYAIVDVEIGLEDYKIHDIGALRYDGAVYHKVSKEELFEFFSDVDYIFVVTILFITMLNICSRIKHVVGF